MLRTFCAIAIFAIQTTGLLANETPEVLDNISAESALGSLSFNQPLGIVPVPGDPTRLLIVEKVGKIQLVERRPKGGALKTQILDLTTPHDGTFEQGGECGLLGAALHPDFSKNRQLFVYYSLKIDGKLFQRLSRFILKDISSMEANGQAEQPIITQLDPASNHNGGDLHFGPDGYLYISCGDGGAAGDKFNNSGDLTKGFFASIFRVDVDLRPGNLAPSPHPGVGLDSKGRAYYSVPADNPFVGATQCRGVKMDPSMVRTEAWAIGLRNPWRVSFDPLDGRLFAGDVGQNLYEEIDIITRGADYGWNVREGWHAFNKSAPKVETEIVPADPNLKFTEPIFEYSHKLGISITGGVVYRGTKIRALYGAYIFADYGSGKVFALRERNGKWENEILFQDASVTGFGYDPLNGDVLFTCLGSGAVKRIVQK
jgi:glucose/arabinose dehydrogenase